MSQGSAPISDKVTILVFKDNYAARTLQIPVSWISRFGTLIGILVILATLSIVFAVKHYRVSTLTDPAHVHDLELEIQSLRGQLRTAQAKATSDASQTTLPPPSASQEKEKATQAQEPTGGKTPLYFSNLPPTLQFNAPDPSTLSFKIQGQKVSWRGKTLNVSFALQYTKDDKGAQQGRIMIFARGPETFLAYPSGVFNPIGSDSLIQPEKGEHFSVSRYREVKAEFGPLRSHDSIREVEIVILSKEGQVLLYQKLIPSRSGEGTPKSAPRPAEPPTEESAPPVENSEPTNQSAPVSPEAGIENSGTPPAEASSP